MATLAVGKKAPNFTLTDKTGKRVTLASIKAKHIVVYFYPKDDTPGCTIEANEFNKLLKQFEKHGAAVIGISGGNDTSKAKFCGKYKLNLTLLSDSDFKVAKAWGSYGKKTFMGRTYMGIFRRTFLLNEKGIIAKIFDEVSPQGHAAEVLKALSAKATKVAIATKPSAKTTLKPIAKSKAKAKRVSVTRGPKPVRAKTTRTRAQTRRV